MYSLYLFIPSFVDSYWNDDSFVLIYFFLLPLTMAKSRMATVATEAAAIHDGENSEGGAASSSFVLLLSTTGAVSASSVLEEDSESLSAAAMGAAFPFPLVSWNPYFNRLFSASVEDCSLRLCLGLALTLKALRNREKGLASTLGFSLVPFFLLAFFLKESFAVVLLSVGDSLARFGFGIVLLDGFLQQFFGGVGIVANRGGKRGSGVVDRSRRLGSFVVFRSGSNGLGRRRGLDNAAGLGLLIYRVVVVVVVSLIAALGSIGTGRSREIGSKGGSLGRGNSTIPLLLLLLTTVAVVGIFNEDSRVGHFVYRHDGVKSGR